MIKEGQKQFWNGDRTTGRPQMTDGHQEDRAQLAVSNAILSRLENFGRSLRSAVYKQKLTRERRK